MFQHQGIWLPDGEKHFPEWMTRSGEMVDGKGTYQIKKFRAAMQHIPFFHNYHVAIDVGAHVGLWSMQLAKKFAVVHAFEPVAAYRECFLHNVDAKGVLLYPFALGAEQGRVSMKIPTLNGGLDTGGTHVVPGNDVELKTLDEFDFHNVDFIKIDCEGFEEAVIKGARETIERCRPVMIVEQKPHKLSANYGIKGAPAIELLKSMGARVSVLLSGDYIMVFE